ncbi:HNH endonuclease [Acinetobacter sp. ANC 4635]|uniref:HNH endonuclease n=1 Tax=Acinetobacter sp. ANC 4635 TaxID=2529846 RepID=UPI00103BAF29|nr:HNH endonuclease [Acinetobacter sp. ANC 4635]TCB31955.1 HNH endonuclease [Acinetobacter sp. ANC 4635]
MKLQTLKPRLQPRRQQTETRNNWGNGRGGRPWRRLKESIHARDGYTCQLCGRVTHQLECDHKINTAQGGTDDPSNLWSLCVECHKQKTLMESHQ